MSPLGRQSQSQTAGDNAVQTQASGNLVQNFYQNGISEDRARDIARESAISVMDSFINEAKAAVESRVARFDDRLITLLMQLGTQDSLRDPAQLAQVRRAQVGAATTDSADDYQMLASLIGENSKDAGNRKRSTAIARAIDVVAQIDGSALRALTLFTIGTSYGIIRASLNETLQALDQMYGIVLVNNDSLPEGQDWVEHLDVLGAVRIQSSMNFTSLPDLLADPKWVPNLHGYLAGGIAPEEVDQARREAAERFASVGLPPELVPSFSILELNSKPRLGPTPPDARFVIRNIQAARGPLTAAQCDLIIEVCNNILGLGFTDQSRAGTLMRRYMDYPNLARFAIWWEGLSPYFSVTPVGRALALANLEQLHPGLINFDI